MYIKTCLDMPLRLANLLVERVKYNKKHITVYDKYKLIFTGTNYRYYVDDRLIFISYDNDRVVDFIKYDIELRLKGDIV